MFRGISEFSAAALLRILGLSGNNTVIKWPVWVLCDSRLLSLSIPFTLFSAPLGSAMLLGVYTSFAFSKTSGPGDRHL
jgi:hypothetical protein